MKIFTIKCWGRDRQKFLPFHIHICFAMQLYYSSHKEVGSISLRDLSWPCDLLWPTECERSECEKNCGSSKSILSLSYLSLSSRLTASALSSECSHCHVNAHEDEKAQREVQVTASINQQVCACSHHHRPPIHSWDDHNHEWPRASRRKYPAWVQVKLLMHKIILEWSVT